MDTYNCGSMQEWEELVDITTMTKNRMMNVGGFSPCQRVLGFNPFLPGGLLNGDDGHRNREEVPTPKMGDLAIERSMKLRQAAAQAFIEADADAALRRAISSGPRPVLDCDIGEIVYFYRMGADKKLKFRPGYWQGPARIMALSGWLDDIVKIKKDLLTEPVRGFLDLSDQPLPPEAGDKALDDLDYEPSEPPEGTPMELPIAPIPEGLQEPLGYPPPAKRYRTKAPQENLHPDQEAEQTELPQEGLQDEQTADPNTEESVETNNSRST